MLVLLTLAAWSLIATLAGLVTGVPELRTFGSLGVAVFVGFAMLVDQYHGMQARRRAWRGHMSDPRPIDDFDAIEFNWQRTTEGANE